MLPRPGSSQPTRPPLGLVPAPDQGLECHLQTTCFRIRHPLGWLKPHLLRPDPSPSASGCPSPLRFGRLLNQDRQGKRWWPIQSAFLFFVQGWTSSPAVLHTVGFHPDLGNRLESVTEQDMEILNLKRHRAKVLPHPRYSPKELLAHTRRAGVLHLLRLRAPRGQPG